MFSLPDIERDDRTIRRGAVAIAPHMTQFPCLAISSLVLGLNLLADSRRETALRG